MMNILLKLIIISVGHILKIHGWGCRPPVGRVYCKPETSVPSCILQFSTANMSNYEYDIQFYNGAPFGSVANSVGQWYSNPANNTQITMDNQQNIILTLLNVQVSNAGTYRINLENTVCNCLFVTGVPSKPSISKNRDPSIGESATLTCLSTSTTTPSNHSLSMRYDWSVNDLENPVDTRYTYSTSRNTLTVSDAQKEDSSKAFACRGTEVNSAGYSSVWSSQISLDIKYPPDEMPAIQQGTNFLMIENTTAQLSCSVVGGNPLPNLTWNCYGSISDSSVKERVTKVVTFTASRRQDRSCYCIMSHPSRNQTVSISVGILFPPSTPTFSIGQVNVSGTVRVIQSKTLTITCTSSGNPQPSITWKYGGNTRSDPLVIQNIQNSDNGQFTCGAENIMSPSLGNSVTSKQSSSVSVLVLYEPKSPEFRYGSKEGQPIATNTLEVIQNDSFSISCVSDGEPAPQYLWSEQTGTSPVLTVERITGNQTRRCTVSYTMTETVGETRSGSRTADLKINVMYPPTTPVIRFKYLQGSAFTIDKNLSVIEQNTFNVTCYTESRPPPLYSWSTTGSSTSDLLTFESVKRTQQGVHLCDVSNTMRRSFSEQDVTGRNSKSFTLHVLYAPRVSPIDKIDIVEGLQLIKTCEFTPGNPSYTQFVWSRSRDKITWTNQNLTFGNISRSDASNYTCTATNTMEPTGESAEMGVDSKTMVLNVWYSSSVTLFTLNDKRDSVTVAENDTIVVQCNVDSNPGSTMILRHNNQELLTMNNVKTLTHSLPRAHCTDTGRYTCVGYNQHNVQHSAVDITFFVKCSPRPSPLVPLTKSVRSPLHASATLQFTALAYPVPDPSQFKWYKENNSQLILMENNKATQISTEDLRSNLTIVNVTEPYFGNYTLKIQNAIGSWEQAFILEPYGVPNTPTGLKQLDEKATLSSVTLQWTPGFNGGPQQTFVLKYRKIGTQQWTTVNITHHGETEMTHEIQQLSSGTQYEVVLLAANIIGSSTESLSINASTAVAASPPGINGAVIGGAVGGGAGCAIILIVVVVAVIFIRRRKIKNGTDKSRLAVNTKKSRNTEDDDSDEDVMVENKMYESAGAVMTKDEPVYNKPTKKVKVESKNTDVYAVVDKTKKKDAEKVKKEKQKKKTQFSEGDVYENACEKSTPGNTKYENAAFEGNLYENPEGSKPCKTPKKNVNADGLIYADLAFNDQPKGQKKLVIHGLDEMTTYVQVDFKRKADPLPDSDTEEQSENKKK